MKFPRLKHHPIFKQYLHGVNAISLMGQEALAKGVLTRYPKNDFSLVVC